MILVGNKLGNLLIFQLIDEAHFILCRYNMLGELCWYPLLKGYRSLPPIEYFTTNKITLLHDYHDLRDAI